MPVSLSNNPPFILGPNQRLADSTVEVYRWSVPFALQTAGLAEEIVVDAGASALAGQFLEYAFDARSLTSTTVQANGSDTVIVTFESPRRVRKVKVANSALSSGSVRIGLHRVDIDKVTEDATLECANNSSVSPTFFDAHFALRLTDEGALQPAQVETLEVISYASSPRLGVTLTGLSPAEEPSWFWQGSGEIGQGGEPADGHISDGAALAAALELQVNRHLAALREAGQPLPAQIEATLLIESNAPCRFVLETLTVVTRVVTRSWLGLQGRDADAKQVLRFSSDRLDTVSLSFGASASGAVHSATLRVVESRAAAQPPLGIGSATEGGFPQPDGTHGLQVESEIVALAITPPEATTATGLAVALLALAPELTLHLALRGDANGAPAGPELASTRATGPWLGEKKWITAWLPRPVPLSSQRIWLTLTVEGGASIWLSESGSAATETATIRVRTDSRSQWVARTPDALTGLAWRVLSVATPTVPSQALIGAPQNGVIQDGALQNGSVQKRLLCWLADTQLSDTLEGDTHQFDLAPALNAFLQAAHPSDAQTLVSAPLTFQALGMRQATVYPPRLEFEPGGD